ncbi:HD domain-containing protein [Fuchsiella alkaliacetigena]|uniref:HD domain-containing protein n=1 Tax=Fuchsiella alkaliacetigena TaxID=957042 RepID=UPI00200A8A2F|nr:diguanylate cyclase [Fuchsiella alkaliacetigena]MCK8825686.1 diguanylate cyclase [Fuchsiella alkaliacetigena]
MIVDDNLHNLSVLNNILADNDYNVVTVSNGKAALKLVEEKKPELIILDIMMPELDGYEVCKRLKANPETKQIPVIFLSALNSVEDKLKGFDLGAVDFITKPFRSQEVIARVSNHLELRMARQQLQRKVAEQELLLENIDIQIWYLDSQHTCVKANSAFVNFLSLTKSEVEGRSVCEFLDKDKHHAYFAGNQEVFKKEMSVKMEAWVENFKGEERLLTITKVPKLNEAGKVEYAICWARDITAEREKQKQIRYLNFYDQLTGLYNKNYFREELKRLDAPRQLPITIIFIDVNGLKLVNDVFGHQVGDELLSLVGEILQDCSRQEDLAVRWGGDEFIILLPQVAEKTARKICRRIKEECEKKKLKSISPSLSLGYAVKKEIEEDIEQTLREAEERMYNQKVDQGREFRKKVLDNLVVKLAEEAYETSTHQQALKELALKLGQLCNLSTKELNKLEALAKYHDIGKVVVPTEVLQKSEKLTAADWQQIKKHSQAGYQIARSTHLGDVSTEILAHHEWWNGEGYPQALKGEKIPLVARIFTIVEAYQVMREGRPYQEPLSKEAAIKELKSKARTQFDPQLVKKFVKKVLAE